MNKKNLLALEVLSDLIMLTHAWKVGLIIALSPIVIPPNYAV